MSHSSLAGRGRPRGRGVLLALAVLCWAGFLFSLVPLLFVWVAVGNERNGTGLAWPLTAASAAVLLLAVLFTLWAGRRTRSR